MLLKNTIIALSLASTAVVVPVSVVAQTAATADPARLKLAEAMAGKIIPPGSYQKMMKDMTAQMADGMMSQMLGMDASVIAKAAGDDAVDTQGKSLGDLATAQDPHFKERMDIMMKVMFDEMGTLMSAMEPAARNGLAKVYARKYTTPQLKEMNAFFDTPSGATFAADFMATFTDKEMTTAMMGEMPKLIEAMPAIMAKVEAATAHLPPMPKAPADAAAEAAVDAAAAAMDAAGEGYEYGTEPWFDRSNWSKADQSKAAKIEAASEKISLSYFQFEEAAIERAKQRYLKSGWTPAPKEAASDAPMAAEDIPADAVPPPAAPE